MTVGLRLEEMPPLPRSAPPSETIDVSSALRLAVVVDASPAGSAGESHSPAMVLAEHLSHRATAVDVLGGDGRKIAGRRGLPAGRADLVVGITGDDGDADCAVRIAGQGRARLVLVVRGLARPAPDAVTRSLRAAGRVAVPSEPFRQELQARGIDGARIDLMPPWARSAPALFDRADARRRLGWPERAFVAVHCGLMDETEHLDELADAAGLLGPESLVVLAGGGPVRRSLTTRAEGNRNLLLARSCTDETQALALVAADAVIVTEPGAGRRLAVPAELATGLSAGRPIVAPVPVAGAVAAELARTGGAGLVVPPHEPARLAGALLALHADPCRRVAMGLAAIAHAERQLSRDAALARFDHIVDAALDDAAPPPLLAHRG